MCVRVCLGVYVCASVFVTFPRRPNNDWFMYLGNARSLLRNCYIQCETCAVMNHRSACAHCRICFSPHTHTSLRTRHFYTSCHSTSKKIYRIYSHNTQIDRMPRMPLSSIVRTKMLAVDKCLFRPAAQHRRMAVGLCSSARVLSSVMIGNHCCSHCQ